VFFRADEATTGTPIALATGLHVLVLYHILWYAVNMAQKKTSIRLSDTAQTLLQRLAESLGISQSAVIEQAIRTLAKKEGVRVERVEKQHD
jgi:biotin operon repressor